MDYAGMIYHGIENVMAHFTAKKQGDYIVVRICIDEKEVIKFPLPADSDSNVIKAAITNVINQTKLGSIGLRVVCDSIPA